MELRMGGLETHDALLELGFHEENATSKVWHLKRGALDVYVKRGNRLPLVVHPSYDGCLDRLLAIPGVATDTPVAHYVNVHMRRLPVYRAPHRSSESRFGLDLGTPRSMLATLITALEDSATVETPDGPANRLVDLGEDPATEREAIRLARIGQGRFRSNLIQYWSGRCAVTGLDQAELLRASHIRAWADSNDRERLDPFNGLLLAVHIDALFDQHLLSFSDDGTILLSPSLSPDNRGRLGISPDQCLQHIDARHCHYLREHRDQLR